jgi:hypothetical protein
VQHVENFIKDLIHRDNMSIASGLSKMQEKALSQTQQVFYQRPKSGRTRNLDPTPSLSQ